VVEILASVSPVTTKRRIHMRQRLITACAFLVCVLALPILAQNPTVEYGHPSELRGVKKVFVDAGTDIELRNRILAEIQKRLPDLTTVSAPEAADIHLRFSLKEQRDYGVIVPVGGRIGVPYSVGVGSVVKVLGENRLRVLLSFKDSRTRFGERRPSTNFAREFVDAYRKANK
jgi:hypothetical protein